MTLTFNSCVIFVMTLTSLSSAVSPKVTYPKVKKDPTAVDIYFGEKVGNPFKWLTNATEQEKIEFMTEQSTTTNSYVKQISTADRKTLEKFLKIYEHDKFLRFSGVMKGGENYFFHDKYENKVYVQKGPNEKCTILLSSESDTTKVPSRRILDANPSPTGDKIAYSFSICFKIPCFNTLKFKSIATTNDPTDSLNYVYSALGKIDSFAWNGEGSGIYYMTNTSTPFDVKVKESNDKKVFIFYHGMGTKQNDDILLAEIEIYFDFTANLKYSTDGQFLVASFDPAIKFMNDKSRAKKCTKGSNKVLCKESTILYVLELCAKGRAPCKPTPKEKILKLHKIEPDYSIIKFLDNIGSDLYFFNYSSNVYYAPSSIVQFELSKSKEKDWKTLNISMNGYIVEVKLINSSYLFVVWAKLNEMSGIGVEIIIYNIKDKKSTRLTLPTTLSVFDVTTSPKDNKVTFMSQSILSEWEAFTLDVSIKPLKAEKIQLPGITTHPFKESVVYEMKNYTVGSSKFPILVMHAKEVKQDGSAPMLLLLNHRCVVTTSIKTLLIPFMQIFKGMVGVAEIEMERHKNSPIPPTSTSINSAIAAVEFVIKEKYTDKSKLTLLPGHDGFSSLVGVLINQRPNLFGGALLINPTAPTVGVIAKNTDTMKWIRAHCSKKLDLSSLYKSKEITLELIKVSPISNIKPSKTEMPAILLIDIGTDDALRYIAQLQSQLGSNDKQVKPFLGKFPVEKLDPKKFIESSEVDQYADIFSFLVLSMNYKVMS